MELILVGAYIYFLKYVFATIVLIQSKDFGSFPYLRHLEVRSATPFHLKTDSCFVNMLGLLISGPTDKNGVYRSISVRFSQAQGFGLVAEPFQPTFDIRVVCIL
jgi:hypothetical protein